MSEYNVHYNKSAVSMEYDAKRGIKSYFYNFKHDPRDAKYETFMDFDTWLPLYNGDPDNWHYVDFFYGARLPFYTDEEGMCHFVKFISRRDYNKMKKVFDKKKSSMEQEVNLQEQIELSTIIRKRALKRSKEALDRQKKAEQELQELTEQMVNIGIQSTLKIPEERRIWGETLKPRSWEETI